MEQHAEEMEIDLLELILVLLRKWWILGLSAVLAAAVGFSVAKFVIEPTYESTTSVYVISRQNEEATTYSDMQLGTQLMKDFAVLAASRTVAEKVIEELALDVPTKDLQAMLHVSSASDTRIMYIKVTHTDPAMAQRIADTVREAAAQHALAVMDVEAVNVAETANLPTEKAAPSISKYTILGGLLGGFLAAAVIVVLFLLDDTIKSPDDVEKYLGLSTLGTIPLENISDEKNGKAAKRNNKIH